MRRSASSNLLDFNDGDEEDVGIKGRVLSDNDSVPQSGFIYQSSISRKHNSGRKKRENMWRSASSALQPLIRYGDEEDGLNFGTKGRALSDNEINSEFLRRRDFRDGDEEDGGIKGRALSDNDSIPKLKPRINFRRKKGKNMSRPASSVLQILIRYGDEENGLNFGIKGRALSDNETNSESLSRRDFGDGDEEDELIFETNGRALSDNDSITKLKPRMNLHKRQSRRPCTKKTKNLWRVASSPLQLLNRYGDEEDGLNFGIKGRDLSDNEINSEFLRRRDFRDGDEEDELKFETKGRALSDNDFIPKLKPRINLHRRQSRKPCEKKRKDIPRAASSALLRDFQDGDEEHGHNFGIKGSVLSDNDSIPKQNPHISLRKRQPRRPYEDFESPRKYGSGRQERSRPARLKRQQIQATAPAVTFGYELYDGYPDQSTTVLLNSYIDPELLKLQCRIGHGFFGDVWIGTHHPSGKDNNEYQKVAVKKLHPMNENYVHEFLHKFEDVWRNLKSKQLNGVCWLHGISIISGQICIVFKWYERSVGGQIVCTDERKLPLRKVLRYSSDLAYGIQQLHQLGHLVLNLKPSNFLLDEHDHIFLGDFGIPYLLLGTFWSDPCFAMRLGTPNYMAPEQWEPGVRGPVSYETDSWGFACSMIEMLTGVPPWFGRSTEEMHHAVVINQEKPKVPTGLPPAIERILEGCFEYDFRKRPLIPDILHVLEREEKAVSIGSSWSEQGRNLYVNNGLTTWFLLKDHILVGDTVRSKKGPKSLLVTQGVVVGQHGLDRCCERDKLVAVQCPNKLTRFRLNVSTLQRVTSGIASGDWVQLVKANKKHSSLGIVHHIHRDGNAAVGFLGLETLWRGWLSELKLVEPFLVGQFVRLKENISDPQFDWPCKRGTSWCSGKISKIHPNGCLEVTFPGRLVLGDESRSCFLANPNEVEHVSFKTCRGIVEKYEYVEDLHWAVKPVAILLGLVTVANIGAFYGRDVLSGISERMRKLELCNEENRSKGWLLPKVANIIFKAKDVSSYHF